MEIKKLTFEKQDIQIKELYVDENGVTKERVKTVKLPTGTVLSPESPSEGPSQN